MLGSARLPESRNSSGPDDRLRRDRVVAIVVLIVLLILTALVIWAATWGASNVPGIDNWPLMMP
jgi:hypothetical protein